MFNLFHIPTNLRISLQSADNTQETVGILSMHDNPQIFIDKKFSKCFEYPSIGSFFFTHQISIKDKPKTLVYYQAVFFREIYQIFETDNFSLNKQIKELYETNTPINNERADEYYDTFFIFNVLIFDGFLDLITILSHHSKKFCIDIYTKEKGKKRLLKEDFFLFLEEKHQIERFCKSETSGDMRLFLFPFKYLQYDFDSLHLYDFFDNMKFCVDFSSAVRDEEFMEYFYEYLKIVRFIEMKDLENLFFNMIV